MTEAEWAACPDPEKMLTFLRGRGRVSGRKLRLLGCACCREAGHLLTHQSLRMAVETAERYADGQARYSDMVQAAKAVESLSLSTCEAEAAVSVGIWHLVTMGMWWNLRAIRRTERTILALVRTDGAVGPRLAGVLHCIIGPLGFRKVAPTDVSCLTLAQRAYDDPLLPSGHLSPDRLAALAAALEAAGCADASLLAHLRGPGPHVRGCFAIDAILGKG